MILLQAELAAARAAAVRARGACIEAEAFFGAAARHAARAEAMRAQVRALDGGGEANVRWRSRLVERHAMPGGRRGSSFCRELVLQV